MSPDEPSISLRGLALTSIFELVGRDENALTFALGWCLAKVPPLLTELVSLLDPGQQAQARGAKVVLQEHSGKNGITDIELRVPGRLAWIPSLPVSTRASYSPSS